jgi:hypothetical protein
MGVCPVCHKKTGIFGVIKIGDDTYHKDCLAKVEHIVKCPTCGQFRYRFMFENEEHYICPNCFTTTLKVDPKFEVKTGIVLRGINKKTSFFRMKTDTGEEIAVKVRDFVSSYSFFPSWIELRRGDKIVVVYRTDEKVDPEKRNYPILIKNLTVGEHWYLHGQKFIRIAYDSRTRRIMSLDNPMIHLALEVANKVIERKY